MTCPGPGIPLTYFCGFLAFSLAPVVTISRPDSYSIFIDYPDHPDYSDLTFQELRTSTQFPFGPYQMSSLCLGTPRRYFCAFPTFSFATVVTITRLYSCYNIFIGFPDLSD